MTQPAYGLSTIARRVNGACKLTLQEAFVRMLPCCCHAKPKKVDLGDDLLPWPLKLTRTKNQSHCGGDD